jgi:ATP-binding cassette, subfamily B, bacterial
MNEQPMNAIAAAAWPADRIAEAIEALARRAGLRPRAAASDTSTPAHDNEQGFEHWLDHTCSKLGLEMEAVDAHGGELSATLRAAAPALLRLPSSHVGDNPASGYLLLLGASGRQLQLLRPDLRMMHVPLEIVRATLCADVEAPASAEIDALLARSELPARRRAAVRRTLVQERSAAQRFAGIWLLRLPPSASAWTQLLRARVPSRLLLMLGIFALLYALEIAGWALIGRGALAGRLDAGWLFAWALLLLGMVPLRMAGGWLQGALSIDAGLLLKQRLLSGALQMDMQQVRQQGAGQLLSRVIESQALESLALNGGFAVLIALLELLLAGWVLTQGAGGGWHAALLVAWLGVGAWFAASYYRRLQGWTSSRLQLTQELIERMVGHRTRLVQRAAHTHVEEDGELDRYLETSQHFDRAFVPLASGLPRGWLLLALTGLAPVFVAGNATPTALAIALGGVLLGYRGLAAVSFGIAALLRAAIAAKEVAPMFDAAARELAAPALLTSPAADGNAGKVLVQARDLVYRHQANGEPVLDGCNLTIQRGDRVLLEGPSGGGKSTLASLLVGLRRPDAGLLLLDGLDQATLGDSWRRSSTGAPQFHENHVLTGPFAFNLLMGRRWPASETDMREADALCRELGLGDLIDRMPSGLMQIVGETGWQLSHGERSRMYLARALLQKSELVVLDESFAALDPDTLERCLRCALKQSSTLMVIAHP